MRKSHNLMFLCLLTAALAMFLQVLRQIKSIGQTLDHHVSDLDVRLRIVEESVESQGQAIREITRYDQPSIP